VYFIHLLYVRFLADLLLPSFYWALISYFRVIELDPFADSPRDSVQFIEWSPTSCPRALLIANFHGRITIWTQPSQVS
jgi:hypothetical protein